MTSVAHVWNKTLVKSNAWLKDVGAELGVADAQVALLALRSVLHALRDRLPPDEAVDLAGQMPLLIKGVYFDGWDPSATPIKTHSLGEFFALVERPLRGGAFDLAPERVVRAVFRVLTGRVSEGEIRDVRSILPRELAELWPVGAGSL